MKGMKLWYDRKSKDPTYFVQLGIRNGKKTTTKNIARIGRHSELLRITDDPLSYAREQVAKYNEEAKNNNQVSLELKIGSLTPEHLEITHKASNGLIFLSNFQFTIPRYS